jgi:surface protein
VDTYINSGSTGSYGPIEDWDTSLVTDMSYVFRDKSSFNANISAWEVGKVTNMAGSTYTLSPLSKIESFFGCFYISLLLSVAALILYLNNALSSFFSKPIFFLGLFFVAVVQCLTVLLPSMVISPHGRLGK